MVERAAGHAVDDIAVELPVGRPPDVLITSAESVPGVEVESMRPHSGLLSTHHELELIDEITGDPERGLALLAEGVPRIFRAGWALVVRREGPGPTGWRRAWPRPRRSRATCRGCRCRR